jgi:ribosomal protein S18 acetylase RimI-like enzyme
MPDRCQFRIATLDDLEALNTIEQAAFDHDRLNMRSLRRWIVADHGIFLVAQQQDQVVGYGLVWCHRGTRLARLYSLAVLPSLRGQGIAGQLLTQLEQEAANRGRLFMRLEVAKHNLPAIRLYEQQGYRTFGEYSDYYDDHSDALRMQKVIQHARSTRAFRSIPWYQQTTEFSCGPAALMMAMAGLDSTLVLDRGLEIDLWREATTIYMTRGHGGCHPLGLALAASRRGYQAEVFINTTEPLFLDGVRSDYKKSVLNLVHQRFLEEARATQAVALHHKEITQGQVQAWLEKGYGVVIMISTYRLDGKKAPHWVTVTNIDDRCLYVHDPDPDGQNQIALDCQHLPIARQDFNQMSAFGSGRLRTALAIKPVRRRKSRS